MVGAPIRPQRGCQGGTAPDPMPKALRQPENWAIAFFAGAFLALLLLNLSNRAYYSETAYDIAAYFGAPAVLAGLTLASLWLPVPTKRSIALCFIAAVAALYAVEGWLTYGHLNRLSAEAAPGEGPDRRDKLTVIEALRAKGDDAYPAMRMRSMLTEGPDGSLVPSLEVGGKPVLPFASLPRATIVACNESGRWLVYRADRHGFNNPDAVWDRPMEIAVLGDSFAHGSCVRTDENLQARLGETGRNVVSLGTSGLGPLGQYAILREYVVPNRPPVVLWLFYEDNDLVKDQAIEARAPLVMHYLADDTFRQGLLDDPRPMTAAFRAYLDRQLASAIGRTAPPAVSIANFFQLYFLRNAVGLGEMSMGLTEAGHALDIDLFARILAKAQSQVSVWGGRLHFVFLPASDRYLARGRFDGLRRWQRREVLRIVADLGLPLIDGRAVFLRHGDPAALFEYPGSHYSPAGYAVIADAIAKHLGGAAR